MFRRYSTHSVVKQSTLKDIYKLYKNNEKISVITAHDFISARIADSTPEIDAVLVGDSLAMVAKGHPSTLELEFDDFYYSTKSVVRAINSKFLIVDMPFGSFESSLNTCIENSVKLMKLGKIGAIKLEGSYEMSERISTLTNFGIPICAHIGLQPQKFNLTGGYTVQGKSFDQALDIFNQAKHLQKMGANLLVLECVPHKLATLITQNLNIPTIGIGAGNGTSGQVLVMSDALGMLDSKKAKFVKPYLDFNSQAINSLQNYSQDVKNQSFPETGKHTFKMDDEIFNSLLDHIKSQK